MSVMTMHGNGLTALALYLTILSGYLVAAYVVGADLDMFQVFFINAIFLFFAATLAMYSFAMFFGGFRGGPNGGAPGYMFYLLYVFVACEILAVLGAIKFMHDIRVSKRKG